MFFKWITNITVNNNKQRVFDPIYFKEILHLITRKLVYNIFFVGNRKGIDKKWRLKALLVLPMNESTYVVKKHVLKK